MPSLTCNQERKLERMGAVLFRLTLLACGVLAATAGPALATPSIEFIPPAVDHGTEVRVIGDGTNEAITMSEDASNVTFTPTGTTLSIVGGTCNPAGATVRCTKPASVSIDM